MHELAVLEHRNCTLRWRRVRFNVALRLYLRSTTNRFGHFYKYAPVKIQYAIDRYTMETKRILDVLDKTLQDREFVAFEYSIADMAIFPWIRSGIDKGYGASEFVGLDQYTNIQRWLREIEKRPAVQRGLRVNSTGKDGIPNRHSTADFDTPAQPNL
jgi:GST-like protein